MSWARARPLAVAQPWAWAPHLLKIVDRASYLTTQTIASESSLCLCLRQVLTHLLDSKELCRRLISTTKRQWLNRAGSLQMTCLQAWQMMVLVLTHRVDRGLYRAMLKRTRARAEKDRWLGSLESETTYLAHILLLKARTMGASKARLRASLLRLIRKLARIRIWTHQVRPWRKQLWTSRRLKNARNSSTIASCNRNLVTSYSVHNLQTYSKDSHEKSVARSLVRLISR